MKTIKAWALVRENSRRNYKICDFFGTYDVFSSKGVAKGVADRLNKSSEDFVKLVEVEITIKTEYAS